MEINYLGTNNLLFPNQHVYKCGQSCQQLFQLIAELHTSMHSYPGTDFIFVDFFKAYNRVPHKKLTKKTSGSYLDLFPEVE